jgi:hypothetical protein
VFGSAGFGDMLDFATVREHCGHFSRRVHGERGYDCGECIVDRPNISRDAERQFAKL